MTGAKPRLPDLPSMRMLLEAARLLGGAHGTVMELCILTMCLPWEAVAIRIGEIDWGGGSVPVPARGGTRRLLHLPPDAVSSLTRAVATGSDGGQAVTGGRDRPLDRRDVRLDRMQAGLATAAPHLVIRRPWNFHGLRAAAAGELLRRGSVQQDVALALGLKRTGNADVRIGGIRTSADDARRAAATLGRWNAILTDRGDPG